MASMIGLFVGGTTGLRDGTLIEPIDWATSTSYSVSDAVSESGDAYICIEAHTSGTFATDLAASKWVKIADDVNTAPYSFPDTTTYQTIHYRVINENGEDPSEDSTGDIDVATATGTEFSFNTTDWFTTTETIAGITATGANKPMYVRQTSRQSTSTGELDFGGTGISFTAGTRPAVGTVTPTAGDGSVVLAWSDIALTGTGYYEVQRATDSGFTANLITLTSTLADGSTGYTNNATNGNAPVNGTTYYYRVRAFDGNGVGAWSNSGAASPVGVTHTDDFNNSSLSTTLWDSRTSGAASVVEDTDYLTLSSISTTGYALYRKNSLVLNADKTYKWRYQISTTNLLLVLPFMVMDLSAPVNPGSTAFNLSYQANTSTTNSIRLQTANDGGITRGTSVSGGTARYWNATNDTWGTSGVSPTHPNNTWYVMEFSTNSSSQWKRRILSGDESTVVDDTGWQSWTGITGFSYSPYLIIAADYSTASWGGTIILDWYDET